MAVQSKRHTYAAGFPWLPLLLVLLWTLEIQADYGLQLDTFQSPTLLSDPDDQDVLSVDVSWDDEAVDDVVGLLDGTTTVRRSSFSRAMPFFSGSATFSVDTAGLPEGRYTLNMTATVSGASPEMVAVIIFLMKPIASLSKGNFKISPSEITIPLPDGKVSVTVSTTDPSFVANALCYWNDISVNRKSEEFMLKLPDDFPVQKNFTFETAESFEVEFYCHNTKFLSYASHRANIKVSKWELKDFTIKKNLLIFNGTVPTEDFKFNFKLAEIGLAPPDVTVNVSYGDGSPADSFPLTSLAFSHKYPKRGNYLVTVHLMHPQKGQVAIDYKARVGAYQTFVSPSGGLVDEQTFEFSVEVFGGCYGDVYFYWNCDSQKKRETFFSGKDRNITTDHTYDSVDFYSPCFLGDGSGSFETFGPFFDCVEKGEFPGPLEVDGPVDDSLILSLSEETIPVPPGDVIVTALLQRDKHKIMSLKCSFFFDEEQDPDLKVWNGTLNPSESFDFPFRYMSLGEHQIAVNCSNSFTEKSYSFTVTAFNPCFSDDPVFDQQNHRHNNPLVFLDSQDLRLVVRTIVLCPSPSFLWALDEFVSNGTLQREDLDLEQPEADYIEFERGTLEPGLYRIRVNITAVLNDTWIEGSTFVKIIPTPLVAEIKGGTIRKTGNLYTLIDGYSLSYDPMTGMDNKTDLQYYWECQKFETAVMEELEQVSKQPLPTDFNSDCDKFSKEVSPGYRELQVENTSAAMGYLFKLTITKGKRKSDPAVLYLQFDPDSTEILLSCLVNCLEKTATTSPLLLTVECPTCTDTDLMTAAYTWVLIMYDNDTRIYDVVPDFITSYSPDYSFGPSIAIIENKLQACQRYRIMVTMKTSSNLTGNAVLEFLVNCPPTGGNCSVDPTEGDVTTQTFTVSCPGWHDGEYNDSVNATDLEADDDAQLIGKVLEYKYLVRKNGISMPVAESAESSISVQLPMIAGQGEGTHEVVVRIYDVLQDYAEYIVEVSLTSPDINESQTLEEATTYWKDQIEYSGLFSTLDKQLRSVATICGLLSILPIPDTRSPLEIAADNDTIVIIKQEWEVLWFDLNNPTPNPIRDQLRELTAIFSRMVEIKGDKAVRFTGLTLQALGEGLTSILYNPETIDERAVGSASKAVERSAKAFKRLSSIRPFPIGARLNDAVFSVLGSVDKLIAGSIPSYDLSIGTNIIFQSPDMGEDESRFLISRIQLARAAKDRRQIKSTQQAMPKVEQAVDEMLSTLSMGIVLGQPEEQVMRGDVTLAVSKTTGSRQGNEPVKVSSIALLLDTVNEDGSEINPDAPLEIKTSVFNKNPLAWAADGSSYEITSPVVRIKMEDDVGPRKLRKVTTRFQRGENSTVPSFSYFSTNASRFGPDGWLNHRLPLRSGSSAIIVRFHLPKGVTKAVFYFRTGRPPTSSRYDLRVEGVPLPSRRRRSILGLDLFGTPKPKPDPELLGETVEVFVPEEALSPGVVNVGVELPELESNETVDYGYLAFTDSCQVWNEETETWEANGCSVSSNSTPEETECTCDDPPGFWIASSFFVAPNTIDFNTVFLKFDVSNVSVYVTLIALFIVWLLALLWARRKDKQDKERWLVGYLTDNHVQDRHFYLMTVYTGMRRGSGTKSNVRFIVSGQKDSTRVRLLSDGERTLTTASVMTYVLSTRRDLGQMRYLRIWHDDSGEADDASWYLSRFVLEDLHSGHVYNFICERWFARDREDGLIDRVVPAAIKDEALTFSKRFNERARLEITDSHLWLSCCLRPERSTFTRMQRVSCCFALLLLTMITSALFYQAEDNETGESSNAAGMEVMVGPMRFSLTTLWTSTVSILITTVPMFIFVILFRSYRPNPGPRVTVQKSQAEEIRLLTILKNLSKDSDTEEEKDQDAQRTSEVEDITGRAQNQANPTRGKLKKDNSELSNKHSSGMEQRTDNSDLGEDNFSNGKLKKENSDLGEDNFSNSGKLKKVNSDLDEEYLSGSGYPKKDNSDLGEENFSNSGDLKKNSPNLGEQHSRGIYQRTDTSDPGDRRHKEQTKERPEPSVRDSRDGGENIEISADDSSVVPEKLTREQNSPAVGGQGDAATAESEVRVEDEGKENLGKEMVKHLSDLLQKRSQQNPLPHYCVYISWVLLIITVIACAFFLLLYSMQWGSTTSSEWLASFFVSFFESFILMDPVKVLVLACLLAYCASNPFSSTQYQFVDLQRVQKEAQVFGTDKIDRSARPPAPVPEEVLEAARRHRLQEQLARRVFFELVTYLLFVFCIFFIAYSNRDHRMYSASEHLRHMLYSSGGDAPFPFEKISSREDVLRYVKETIRATAFPWIDNLGNELPWQQRFFASDGVSFRLGPVRIRQVRMPAQQPPKPTRWYPSLRSHRDMYPPYDDDWEETGNYCLGWKPTPCPEEQTTKFSVGSWSYIKDVLPVSIWGIHAWYPSSGYVADLAVNRDVILGVMKELEEERWLDMQTRAVFIELCLYNSNTNLFTFLRMTAEFPEFGSVVVWRNLQTFQLYQHLGASGLMALVSELLALVFVIFLTVRAVLGIKAKKCAYFKDLWQVLDLITLMWAYVAMIFYITKLLSVREVMTTWREDPKVYVDFFLPVLWDSTYGYILGGLVFVLSTRLLRVLGYNRRITMLATVLARAGPAMLAFSFIFFLVMTAFVSMGIFLLGSTLESFRSAQDAYIAMYVAILGMGQIAKWMKVSSLGGQLYFALYTFMIIFILYSMFVVILCNVITKVRSDLLSVPPPYGLTGFLGKMYRTVMQDLIPGKFMRSIQTTQEPDVISSLPPLSTSTPQQDKEDLWKQKNQPKGPQKPLSSHRPDDKVPNRDIFNEDLEAEMRKLRQEMQESVKKLRKEMQEKRERRLRAKVLAAERFIRIHNKVSATHDKAQKEGKGDDSSARAS